MKNRVGVLNLKRGVLVLAVIAALGTMWTTTAFAQTDPFGSQYDPPPTAPPSDECGDDGSGSGGSGSGGSGSGSNGSGGTAAGCEEPAAPGSPGDSGTSGSSVLSEESGGPVVDLLPTTGGLPLGAALLGGSALVGAGVVAVRRRS